MCQALDAKFGMAVVFFVSVFEYVVVLGFACGRYVGEYDVGVQFACFSLVFAVGVFEYAGHGDFPEKRFLLYYPAFVVGVEWSG